MRRLWFGGAAVCATVMAVRMLWVWPGTYVPRWLFTSIREREPFPRPRAVAIVGWCGMRGVVSLAAALAVPLELLPGVPFPGRDVILFCTFCTILGTLVLQGLTLEPLLRLFGIESDDSSVNEERTARVELVRAALAKLEELGDERVCSIEEVRSTEAVYRARLAVLENQEELRQQMRAADRASLARNVQLQVLEAQKLKLLALRDDHTINDATQLRLQMELDLDEMRLVR
jgi:CPA1 family monovalent cation:H+ antiporter